MAELTWREVIDATLQVAKNRDPGEDGRATTWFRWAGVEVPDGSWDTPYEGPPIDDWEVPIIIRTDINKVLDSRRGVAPAPVSQRAQKVRSAGKLIKLDVPYVSQKGTTASTHLADCGPSCLTMLINANPVRKAKRTVDKLYKLYLKTDKKQDFTSFADLMAICPKEGLDPEFVINGSVDEGWNDLRTLIRAKRPFIARIKYGFWKEAAKVNRFRGPHFVLVTGFDDEHVYVHDPLFRGGRPNPGEFYPLSLGEFFNGWGGFEKKKANFLRLATDKAVSRFAA